jgi:hypothetical protein
MPVGLSFHIGPVRIYTRHRRARRRGVSNVQLFKRLLDSRRARRTVAAPARKPFPSGPGVRIVESPKPNWMERFLRDLEAAEKNGVQVTAAHCDGRLAKLPTER